jgi:hypothetical protein
MNGILLLGLGAVLCVSACSAADKYAFQLEPAFVYEVAKCAEDSYKPLEELRQDESLSLFFEDDLNTEEAFCGFVKKIGDSLVVAFHGARTWQEELKRRDIGISCVVSGGDGGYKDVIAPYSTKFDTHHGFSKEVMSCYANAINIIEDNEFDQLVFTGHGGGAAIAQLFALRYCVEKGSTDLRNKVKVFAFSSPGVFSMEATKKYHKAFGDYNSIHIYENLDPVTWGPRYCVGIQACLGISSSKGVVEKIFDAAESLGQFFTMHSGALDVASKAVAVGTALHATGFSRSDIEEVLRRIQKNYLVSPFMGWESLGRA